MKTAKDYARKIEALINSGNRKDAYKYYEKYVTSGETDRADRLRRARIQKEGVQMFGDVVKMDYEKEEDVRKEMQK